MPRLMGGYLASGSKGNCFVAQYGQDALLIDAGLSLRETRVRLRQFDVDESHLKAVFVTHEHSDHIGGLSVVSRRLKLPVHASEGTCRALGRRDAEYFSLHPLPRGGSVEVGGITVTNIPVSHDAADPVCYLLHAGDDRMAVVTDLGVWDAALVAALDGVRTLFLESNHEVSWLMAGPYPEHLKRRVRSRVGHLSNEDAAAFILAASVNRAAAPLARVVLSHLSEVNNAPKRALETVRSALARNGVAVDLDVARQHTVSMRYDAEGRETITLPGQLPLGGAARRE